MFQVVLNSWDYVAQTFFFIRWNWFFGTFFLSSSSSASIARFKLINQSFSLVFFSSSYQQWIYGLPLFSQDQIFFSIFETCCVQLVFLGSINYWSTHVFDHIISHQLEIWSNLYNGWHSNSSSLWSKSVDQYCLLRQLVFIWILSKCLLKQAFKMASKKWS